jgi:hypothetical protein
LSSSGSSTGEDEEHVNNGPETTGGGDDQPPPPVPPPSPPGEDSPSDDDDEDEQEVDTVTLGPFDIESTVSARDLPFEKMRGGAWVARALVTTFAASVLLWFFVAALIIGVSASPRQAQQFAVTLVPFLKEYASFATAVFSPLLAFVLGFYFGEKSQQ